LKWVSVVRDRTSDPLVSLRTISPSGSSCRHDEMRAYDTKRLQYIHTRLEQTYSRHLRHWVGEHADFLALARALGTLARIAAFAAGIAAVVLVDEDLGGRVHGDSQRSSEW